MGDHPARGGQDYYLLMQETRAAPDFCPIHRFDGMDQLPMYRGGTQRNAKKKIVQLPRAQGIENSEAHLNSGTLLQKVFSAGTQPVPNSG